MFSTVKEELKSNINTLTQMDRKGNVLLEQRTTIILQFKKKSTVSGERYDKKLRDNEIRIIQFLIQFLKDETHSRYRFD